MNALAISRYKDRWMRAGAVDDLWVYQRQAADLLGVASTRQDYLEIIDALEYWRAVSTLDSRYRELLRAP